MLGNRVELAKKVAQTVENNYQPEQRRAEAYDKKGGGDFVIHL